MITEITQSEIDGLIGETVDLAYNGNIYPSKVTGRYSEFATVAPYDCQAPSFVFSWISVQRALAHGHILKA